MKRVLPSTSIPCTNVSSFMKSSCTGARIRWIDCNPEKSKSSSRNGSSSGTFTTGRFLPLCSLRMCEWEIERITRIRFRGSIPILAGRHADSFSSHYGTPIGCKRFRLLWPAKRSLKFQSHGPAQQPEIHQTGETTEYVWDQSDVPAVLREDEVPAWFDEFPWVQISEFAAWKEVTDWALPLYPTNSFLPQALQDKIAGWRAIHDPEERITAALQFLQDEVRYFGFEGGTQSHRPSEPATVFERGFGDCKDKAYLFCEICRQLDAEAVPALVSTADRGTVTNWLPSPYAFNHVIVRIQSGSNVFWADPTRSHQRGLLHLRYLTDFGNCLLVRPGAHELTGVPPPDPNFSQTTVRETFRVYGKDKPAYLAVKTLARGLDAERLRAQLADISQDDLQKRYLNYYAKEYPGISSSKPLEIQDRPTGNEFSVVEQYQIKDFWTLSSDKSQYECEFFPLTISDQLSKPETKLRTMPLDVPYPQHEILYTEVLLPEPWPADATNEFHTNAAMRLRASRSYDKNKLVMEYDLRTMTNCVTAREVSSYLKSIDQMEKNLGYSLTWPNEGGSSGSQPNWSIVSLGAVYSLLVAFGAVTLYRLGRKPPVLPDFEEPLSTETSPVGLGGWLVLVGLGIVISPIMVGWGMVQSASAYSVSSWHAVTSTATGAQHPLWAPLLIFELLSNLTFIGFCLLLIPLFFNKRATFPKFYIVFLLFRAFEGLLDHFANQFIFGEKQAGTQDTRAIFQAIAPCFIWIPYMLKSHRVKATFVR